MAIGGMAEYEDRVENWRAACRTCCRCVWTRGARSQSAAGQVLEEFWTGKDDMNLGLARTLLAQAGLTLMHRKTASRIGGSRCPTRTR